MDEDGEMVCYRLADEIFRSLQSQVKLGQGFYIVVCLAVMYAKLIERHGYEEYGDVAERLKEAVLDMEDVLGLEERGRQ